MDNDIFGEVVDRLIDSGLGFMEAMDLIAKLLEEHLETKLMISNLRH